MSLQSSSLIITIPALPKISFTVNGLKEHHGNENIYYHQPHIQLCLCCVYSSTEDNDVRHGLKFGNIIFTYGVRKKTAQAGLEHSNGINWSWRGRVCVHNGVYTTICIFMYYVFSFLTFFSVDRYCAVVLGIPEKNISTNCITCLYRYYKEHKTGKESLHHIKPLLIPSSPPPTSSVTT